MVHPLSKRYFDKKKHTVSIQELKFGSLSLAHTSPLQYCIQRNTGFQMSHFSDDHNFREITQNKIITTSLVAWKQCASAFTLRQNKTGAFIAPDQMLFHISLQSICLSKTQTIFRAALQNSAGLDPGHNLPPSGEEHRKQNEIYGTEREGCTLLRSQLPTQLPRPLLLQWHFCSH